MNKETYNSYSGYLTTFNPEYLKIIVRKCSRKINWLQSKKKVIFDAIAFSGESGGSVSYPLSFKTGIPFICVRKFGTITHGKRIEGPDKPVNKYLIIDDCIDSGNTVKYIVEEITKYTNGKSKCAGVLLYIDVYPKEDRYRTITISNSRVNIYCF